jgi:hypothetical protein
MEFGWETRLNRCRTSWSTDCERDIILQVNHSQFNQKPLAATQLGQHASEPPIEGIDYPSDPNTATPKNLLRCNSQGACQFERSNWHQDFVYIQR